MKKTNLHHATILGLVLIAVGLGIFLTKTIGLGYPLEAGRKVGMWDFEVFIEFTGQDRPARIEALLPTARADREIIAEQFYNGPFGLTIMSEPGTPNRKAVWTYRYPNDRKVVRYSVSTAGETLATPLDERFRNTSPEAIPFEADTIKRQAFIVFAGNLHKRSADDASFARQAVKAVFAPIETNEENSDELTVLLGGDNGVLSRLDLLRHTLQSRDIPARIANGVDLENAQRRKEIRHWLEYVVDAEDHRYFPGGAPRRFFTLWYDRADLVTTEGVRGVESQISLGARSEAAADIAARADGRMGAFARTISFDQLPVTTQLVYQVLLTIPVGIAILVFLRQFVGLTTLGTFMPVLIGIAFRETALVNGILLFSILVAMGLALRFYLERLQLLLVPRLAVVLIFIVITMAGLTLMMTGANQSIGLSISLFPMVILTMTIERMSIVWEESSAGEAIKQGLGSLAVASLTYLAMTNHTTEHLMYQFPELLVVLMGLCVLMGRYTGLRLAELWRFRALVAEA